MQSACKWLGATAMQTTLDWLLDSAGLTSYLRSSSSGGGGGNFTLFAPTDAAWADGIRKADIECTFEYYVTTDCDSLQGLSSATNLRQILLNHGAPSSSSMPA